MTWLSMKIEKWRNLSHAKTHSRINLELCVPVVVLDENKDGQKRHKKKAITHFRHKANNLCFQKIFLSEHVSMATGQFT